ncbi:unnamed protein product [Notodromas monacha]|uniref:Uncharacterized protein n=1 Tax=Notodromas monacha TaxID=399045 RepID=A0A7R9BHJ1_9CRUS|nr:unnamed protein product [Notodromas monacha]CAG0914785.1 unnamed protein product [Notodromas monacha]
MDVEEFDGILCVNVTDAQPRRRRSIFTISTSSSSSVRNLPNEEHFRSSISRSVSAETCGTSLTGLLESVSQESVKIAGQESCQCVVCPAEVVARNDERFCGSPSSVSQMKWLSLLEMESVLPAFTRCYTKECGAVEEKLEEMMCRVSNLSKDALDCRASFRKVYDRLKHLTKKKRALKEEIERNSEFNELLNGLRGL